MGLIKKYRKIVWAVVAVILLGIIVFSINVWGTHRGTLNSLFNSPSHAPNSDCHWSNQVFLMKGISFFLQVCPGESPENIISYSQNSNGNIIGTDPLSTSTTDTIVEYAKSATETPFDVIKTVWFAKLSYMEQSKCSIQNADQPVTQFSDEAPHPTPHKTRFEIAPSPTTVNQILEASGGNLPTGWQYQYLCGPIVGSPFDAKSPYFEFDDRSPTKYLFIQSFGNDGGPAIDLNSISF